MRNKILALACSVLLAFSQFAYAEQSVTIDTFKGLQRQAVPSKIEDGAHSRFDNVYINDGNIQAIKGRDRLNSTANSDTTVNGLFYYENSSGTKKLVVKETDEVVTYALDGTGRTQIASTLTDEKADFVQIGNTLYFSSSTDGIYKWTGTGSASAVGSVSAPSSVDFSATSGAGGLTPGLDAVCVISGTGNGFVNDAGSCSAASFVNAVSAASAGTYSTYKYKVVKYNSEWGFESEPSAVDEATLGGNTACTYSGSNCQRYYSGDTCTYYISGGPYCASAEVFSYGKQTLTSGTLAATPSAPFDSYRIYRTVAGGSDYFLAGEDVGGGAYTDGKPDVVLSTVLDTTIDTITPPSYRYLGVFKGILFAAEGTSVRFVQVPVEAYTNADTYWLETDEFLISSNKVIRGLYGTRGSLLVFTENTVEEITGFGPNSFKLNTLSRSFGAVSEETIASDTNGDIFFFAGTRGVYKINLGAQLSDSVLGSLIDRSGTTFTKVSSPHMDSVFQGDDATIDLDPTAYGSAHGYYDIDNDLYILFIGDHEFIYDNVGKTWTHVTNTNMIASEYVESIAVANRGIMLDNLGFFYRNLTGYENGIESGTVTGNPTSSGNTALTDTGAAFNTTNDGLTGLFVCAENATTKALQCRQISSNTATELTISSAWDSNPTVNDTYYIAYIHADIETKQYAFIKPPGETDIFKLYLVHDKADSAQTMSVDHYIDKSTTTEGAKTVDLNDSYADPIGVSGRGMWHQLRFRTHIYNTSNSINPPVNIENYTIHAVGKEAE